MIDEVAPSIRNAAEQLFAQHQARRSLADVADNFWPSDLPAAYAVQDHLQQLYSDARFQRGWIGHAELLLHKPCRTQTLLKRA